MKTKGAGIRPTKRDSREVLDWLMDDRTEVSAQDIINCQTFPQDYNFLGMDPQYICGMSVPPVMMAHVAAEIAEQIFNIATPGKK